MTLALLATSHSPLLEHAELDAQVSAELDAAFVEARRFVHAFDPDVIVNFAPDHYRVVRGGCWLDEARGCRAAHRFRLQPVEPYRWVGFRVVCVAASAE